ncbi:MAG: MEDS domain-containing protein [Vicinamibacterales bacterium]
MPATPAPPLQRKALRIGPPQRHNAPATDHLAQPAARRQGSAAPPGDVSPPAWRPRRTSRPGGIMATQLDHELSNLRQGDHLCPVHDNLLEQTAGAVAFIAAGLRSGERCLYVANDSPFDELVRQFSLLGVDVAQEVAKGSLKILTKHDVYLRWGKFDAHAMLDYLAACEAAAVADGYAGLRFQGEMTWALDANLEGDRLIEYEAMLNEFLATHRAIIACHYLRPRFDPALIHDLLVTHPLVAISGMVCPNPYYQPPELVLRPAPMPMSEFKRRRLDWWIERLRAVMAGESERRQAVDTAREREALVQLLLDSTAEAIYGIDLLGNCMLANPTCARLLGYADPEQLNGRNMHALIHHRRADGRPYPEEECPIVLAIHSRQGVHVTDEVFWRADGTKFDADYFSYPMWRGKELVGAVVTFLDVSTQKTLEEQLRQAQKMEAIGQLAGGVAHDFNNLLSIILGYSEILLQSMPPDDPNRELLDEIRKAGQRSASLTRQLLAFSRKQVLAPKVLDLNDVVRDAEKMLRRFIGEDIHLVTTLDPGIGSVRADPGQLEQALLNLAVNARDAMPQGGRLAIETRNVVLGEDARPHADVRPGRYVMLTVTDTGVGMTDEVKRHLFEPFFTTKEPGRGTGLGLAVVHGIVRQSGGAVEVHSEPGVGTSFKIYLPRVEQTAPSGKSWQDLGPAPRGTETLLLVEDEDAVRALARFSLRQCGHTVLEASHGEEAIRVATDHRETIHLLVTDVVMPGMGGRVLAERLLSLHPEMKVLYLSGYTDDAVVRHGILHEEVNFLQKPLSPAALAHRVREVLAKA